MRQRFFDLPIEKPDLPTEQRSLYRLLSAVVVYIPIMQFLNGIGIIVIAIMGYAGLFDTQEPLLFLVAGFCFLDTLLHLPLFPLLRQGRLEIVCLLLMAINGTLSATQVFLWQDIVWFPLILVASPMIVFTAIKGISPRVKIAILVIGTVLIAMVLLGNTYATYPRIRSIYLANMAALSIYIIFISAMIALTIMNGLINYRAIASRLVTIFTTASIITAIATIVIGSLSNFLDNRNRTFDQLNAISTLQVLQIKSTLTELYTLAAQPMNNPVIGQRIRYVLQNKPGNLAYQINFDLVRTHLLDQTRPNALDELLLIDSNGIALISTNRKNEKGNFSERKFIENARSNLAFSVEANFPNTSEAISLVVTIPVFENNQFIGTLAFRTDFSIFNSITSSRPTSSQTSESYLIGQLDGQIVPITNIRAPATVISTYPTQQTFANKNTSGSGIYENYAGEEVLGTYLWIPEIQTVFVSEIAQQEVLANIRPSLYINLAIGSLMTLLVFIIVVVTSRSISRPIEDLAAGATSLANGELSTRIRLSQKDEIGTLATSFNTMASELQTVVQTLEQTVDERTQDLQKQANYLRIAAEVARDATTAQDIDELLNRAAQLILDRFGFYHTGIFFLDTDREYAVLRASPTEAGREMLKRGHKLKIGQVGIVGYVAATGTPRIALDTGQDATYFNNPLLPQTHSEMGLPLKINNQVIGVLDVQSEVVEAFTQDDISTLQIMADQLALAIQRVQLVSNLQHSLEEIENTYQRFTAESWQKFVQEPDFKAGYSFDGLRLTPLASFPPDVREVLKKGRPVILNSPTSTEETGATVALPLRLREQAIGVIKVRFLTSTVEADVLNLLEDTANRLTVALENARLYAETQKLVQRERAVSEISNRITTSFNIENILRTTVMEIGKIMPEAEVVVQLERNQE